MAVIANVDITASGTATDRENILNALQDGLSANQDGNLDDEQTAEGSEATYTVYDESEDYIQILRED